jgi:type II secretory pathway pseudopilin PulG
MRALQKRQAGFTLLELIVSIASLIILVIILGRAFRWF